MKYLFLAGVFLMGSVVAINLGGLLPTNPNYEAAWWNVFVALILAVFLGRWTVKK